jgi:hypothetical protein
LTGLISTVHGIAAKKDPVWALSDGEEKALGEALADVLDVYAPAALSGMTEGTAALIALVIVCATIYGPRVMMTVEKKKAAKARAKEVKQAIENSNPNAQV